MTVSNEVYLLWFVQNHTEGEDTELLIGVYESEAAARSVIDRLKANLSSSISRKDSKFTRANWGKKAGHKVSFRLGVET